MEKLLKKEDVAAVLQVSPRTAYTYMQQMPHMTEPIRVYESALRAWIAEKTVYPAEKRAARKTAWTHRNTEIRMIPRRRSS